MIQQDSFFESPGVLVDVDGVVAADDAAGRFVALFSAVGFGVSVFATGAGAAGDFGVGGTYKK
jgi:hypothetical protein